MITSLSQHRKNALRFNILLFSLQILLNHVSGRSQCTVTNGQCSSDSDLCKSQNLHPMFCEKGSYAIAFIGNPGTGKSTLLNGLVGRPEFKAGISYGGGLTSQLQEVRVGNVWLYDTPGLHDSKSRKKAGREITRLLKKKLNIILVFVVTLNEGRVNPEDATTLNTVLDSISVDTRGRFGVIINKLTGRVYNDLIGNAFIRSIVQEAITGDERETSHWAFVREEKRLRSVDNGMLTTKELTMLLENLPITKYSTDTVNYIDTDSFEERLDNMKKQYLKRIGRIVLLIAMLKLLGTGSVSLTIASSAGWLLKHTKHPAIAEWFAQKLPIAFEALKGANADKIVEIAQNMLSAYFREVPA